ncbi:TraR/DksA family transcriptional regulator [Microbacterium sp. NPDC055683]
MTQELPPRLRRLGAEIDARIIARDRELAELAEARGTADGDDEHDPEGATLADEWSRLTGLRAAALRDRTRLEAAVARVAAGTYGRCEGCGRTIPEERMDAVPTAVRCVACAARRR